MLAEWVLAAMLFFSRDIPQVVRNQQSRTWAPFASEPLRSESVSLSLSLSLSLTPDHAGPCYSSRSLVLGALSPECCRHGKTATAWLHAQGSHLCSGRLGHDRPRMWPPGTGLRHAGPGRAPPRAAVPGGAGRRPAGEPSMSVLTMGSSRTLPVIVGSSHRPLQLSQAEQAGGQCAAG